MEFDHQILRNKRKTKVIKPMLYLNRKTDKWVKLKRSQK